MKSLIDKPWLYIAILAIGLFFKVYQIDQKFFWYDEIATIAHTSGNQIEPPAQNSILSIQYFKDQLRLNKQDYSLGSELTGLFSSVNLNPLHYPLLMIWTRIFGDGPVPYRWFNVFVFMLTLPILFLLARRLFNNPLAGWIAITLYACSPFINFFTQEARYHITWAFLVILTCYLFLKALEHKELKWWVGYMIAAAAAMYISLISIPLLCGLTLWGFIYKKEHRKQILISSLSAFVIYLPWMIWLYANMAELNSALAWHSVVGVDVSVFKLLFMQFLVPAESFGVPADFMTYRFPSPGFNYPELLSFIPFILIIWGIVYAIRNKTNADGKLLIYVFLPMVLFFVLSDVIRGVGGSMIHRYHMINVVGAIFFLSYLLSAKMSGGKWLFSLAYLVIISMGVYTMNHASKNPVWDMPRQHKCGITIEEGKFYSSKEAPLIISDFKKVARGLGYLKFLEMANAWSSDSIDILYTNTDIKNVAGLLKGKDYSDVFISFSSDQFVNQIRSELGESVKKVDFKGVADIWKIEIFPEKTQPLSAAVRP